MQRKEELFLGGWGMEQNIFPCSSIEIFLKEARLEFLRATHFSLTSNPSAFTFKKITLVIYQHGQ